jgi:hypothetical protein
MHKRAEFEADNAAKAAKRGPEEAVRVEQAEALGGYVRELLRRNVAAVPALAPPVRSSPPLRDVVRAAMSAHGQNPRRSASFGPDDPRYPEFVRVAALREHERLYGQPKPFLGFVDRLIAVQEIDKLAVRVRLFADHAETTGNNAPLVQAKADLAEKIKAYQEKLTEVGLTHEFLADVPRGAVHLFTDPPKSPPEPARPVHSTPPVQRPAAEQVPAEHAPVAPPPAPPKGPVRILPVTGGYQDRPFPSHIAGYQWFPQALPAPPPLYQPDFQATHFSDGVTTPEHQGHPSHHEQPGLHPMSSPARHDSRVPPDGFTRDCPALARELTCHHREFPTPVLPVDPCYPEYVTAAVIRECERLLSLPQTPAIREQFAALEDILGLADRVHRFAELAARTGNTRALERAQADLTDAIADYRELLIPELP